MAAWESYHKRHEAASMIQSMWKSRQWYWSTYRMKEKRKNAAQFIQDWWRDVCAARKAAQQLQMQVEAATKVQALLRAQRVRQSIATRKQLHLVNLQMDKLHKHH